MRMTIILFNGFTALDIVGGYEVLANLPGMEVECVASKCALVANDHGTLGLQAWKGFDQVESTGIPYVPGGPGVPAALEDKSLIDCVRRLANASAWVVGICNGVEILGAAGLLAGRAVTTNWFARDRVAAYGARVRHQRYVRDGQLITGAGVSSSIDVALFMAGLLAGEAVAQTIQLGIEYYPDPRFGNDRPDQQPRQRQEIVAQVESVAAARLARRRIAFE